MGNTNYRVSAGQINVAQQKPALAAPALGNNLLSFNSSSNSAMLSPSSWNNANSSKNGSTDKAVALSAQEISDFLS